MFTLQVGTAEKYEDIEQNETRLRVPFMILKPVLDEQKNQVLKDGEPMFDVVLERNESFHLDASQDEITATLKRHLTVFTEEQANAAASRERQAQLDAAEEVAGKISNIVIE